MSEQSFLRYASLPREVKQIGTDCLGQGVLKSLLSHSRTYHLMLKMSEGDFVGFSLYHYETVRNQAGERIKNGVIDTVCVKPSHRNQGFGTLLTFGTMRKMSANRAKRIELFLKTPFFKRGEDQLPVVGNEELLSSLGFNRGEVYDNYYGKTSLKYRYECIFCKELPDLCKIVLYEIEDEG